MLTLLLSHQTPFYPLINLSLSLVYKSILSKPIRIRSILLPRHILCADHHSSPPHTFRQLRPPHHVLIVLSRLEKQSLWIQTRTGRAEIHIMSPITLLRTRRRPLPSIQTQAIPLVDPNSSHPQTTNQPPRIPPRPADYELSRNLVRDGVLLPAVDQAIRR